MLRSVLIILTLVVVAAVTPLPARADPATLEAGFGLGDYSRQISPTYLPFGTPPKESSASLVRIRGRLTVPLGSGVAAILSYEHLKTGSGLIAYYLPDGTHGGVQDRAGIGEIAIRIPLWGKQ